MALSRLAGPGLSLAVVLSLCLALHGPAIAQRARSTTNRQQLTAVEAPATEADSVPQPGSGVYRAAGSLGDAPDFVPYEDVVDAQGNVVEVRQLGNPYVLAFASGSYTPAKGIDPNLLARLQSDPSRPTFGFIMVRGRMSEAKADALRKTGVELLGVHTYQSFQARIPSRAIGAVAALPFVHWVGYARSAQKLDPRLTVALANGTASQQLRVHVHLFESDAGDRAKWVESGSEQLTQNGLGWFANAPTRHLLPNGPRQAWLQTLGFDTKFYDDVIHAFEGLATVAQVREIAKQDWVHSVELAVQARGADDQALPMMRQDAVRKLFPGTDLPVGLMDSGIDGSPFHFDLRNKQYRGWSTVSSRTNDYLADSHGHGTHVTGTMIGTGRADARYLGAAPALGELNNKGNALVFIGRFLNSRNVATGSPTVHFANFSRDAVINRVTYPKAQVINCSWGASSSNGWRGTEAGARALDNYVWLYKQTYVFAAGNRIGQTSWTWSPGSAKNALTVGALADSWSSAGLRPGRVSSASSSAVLDGRIKPEVCAPGELTTSCRTDSTSGYLSRSGTSMATPAVSGCVASRMSQSTFYRGKPALMKALAVAAAANDSRLTIGKTSGWGMVNSHRMTFSSAESDYRPFAGTLRTTGSSWVGSYTVPADAANIRLVLAFIEPAASSSARQARVCNVRAWIDAPPYSSSANGGDYLLQSGVQNCMSLTSSTVAAAIRGKTVRIKVYASSIPAGYDADFGVVLMAYRKNPDIVAVNQPTLSCAANVKAVRPGANVELKATLTKQANGDQFTHGRIWFESPTSFVMQGLSRTTEDSVVHRYLASLRHPSAPYPGVVSGPLGGMTVGAGTSRSLTFLLRAPTKDGVYTLQSRGTWHDRSAANVRSCRTSVCVDSAPPNAISGLVSSTHKAGQWSNQTGFTANWQRATDSGCAGIRGLASLVSSSSTAVPTKQDITGDPGAVKLTLRESSGWYFTLRAIDNVGNLGSFGTGSRIGPFRIDTTAPVLSAVSINSGASSTTSLRVSVRSLFLDRIGSGVGLGSGVSEVRYSADQRNWSAWSKVGGSISHTQTVDLASLGASSAPGTKTCYVEVRDLAGNVSRRVSDTITLTGGVTIIRNLTASLPNLTKSAFSLVGSGFSAVRGATFNGVALAPWSATTEDNLWRGRYRVVSATSVLIYPPQALRPGTYKVALTSAAGSSNTVGARITAAAAGVWVTSNVHTAGTIQCGGLALGDRKATSALVVISPLRGQSRLPGIVTLGVGNNFQFFLLSPIVAFNATNGVATVCAGAPKNIVRQTIYMQGVYFTQRGPLPVSAVSSTLYR